MKLILDGFVLVVEFALITSLAIKSSQENELANAKQDLTLNETIISLAHEIQQLRAMKVAYEKQNKANLKHEAKARLQKNVISTTTIASPTEIYLPGTTLISQFENDLQENQHVKSRDEVIPSLSQSEPSSDPKEIATDMTSEYKTEKLGILNKSAAKNPIEIKKTLELHKQLNHIKHENIIPDTKQENKHMQEVVNKIHPQSPHQMKHLASTESKHNISQNSHSSNHIKHAETKSNVPQSSKHHVIDSVKPNNKIAKKLPVNNDSGQELNKNKLPKENNKSHGKLATKLTIASSKADVKQNPSKSDSNNHHTPLAHKKPSAPISSPNHIDHNQKVKISIANHKIKATALNEDESLVDPTTEITRYIGLEVPSKEESNLADSSEENVDMVDPENVDIMAPSKADTDLVASTPEGSDLENSNKKYFDIINSPTKKSNLIGIIDDSRLKENDKTGKKEMLAKISNTDDHKMKVTEEVHNQNNSKYQQRKIFIKKNIQKYHPVKLTHNPLNPKSQNLNNFKIEEKPTVTLDKSNKSKVEDTTQQKMAPILPDPKLPKIINTLVQNTKLKQTNFKENQKDKENIVIENNEVKNQDSKDVLAYLKQENKVGNGKRSASTNYIITVTSILIVSTVLFIIVGVYYRLIRIDRQKYIGHILLETEDDEDMHVFNRETYHDDTNHGYESWNAIR